ncbi:hypothetical protein [Hymenobacter jeollabukensis]|uniref:Uncharacterized protein n=1 Tax=Hymenobacter jeollabukensis TaxID=2025313 RepID=A0A5R8WIJ3_9BACT|nr:hypothetical protein [Hymenobacter jeollabukensis]TLM88699.1 hypothetical protein FDY95_22965 [Hymenobacter jeollabukensis]
MFSPEAWLCLGVLTALATRIVRRQIREGRVVPAMFDFMTIEMMLMALAVLCWPALVGPAGPPPLAWAMAGWSMEVVRLLLLAWVDDH